MVIQKKPSGSTILGTALVQKIGMHFKQQIRQIQDNQSSQRRDSVKAVTNQPTVEKIEIEVKLVEFNTLKAGKSFCELALIKNQLRAATIQCLEDCHFAVIQKDDYEKVLQKIE